MKIKAVHIGLGAAVALLLAPPTLAGPTDEETINEEYLPVLAEPEDMGLLDLTEQPQQSPQELNFDGRHSDEHRHPSKDHHNHDDDDREFDEDDEDAMIFLIVYMSFWAMTLCCCGAGCCYATYRLKKANDKRQEQDMKIYQA